MVGLGFIPKNSFFMGIINSLHREIAITLNNEAEVAQSAKITSNEKEVISLNPLLPACADM